MKPLIGSLMLSALIWGTGGHALAVERNTLFNVSQEILRLYNDDDSEHLFRLLAPELQTKYTPDTLKQVLRRCKELFGRMQRFSLPTMGTRTFAFFAAYGTSSVYDMIVEVDKNAKLFHWVITSDVQALDQPCSINRLPGK
ncbi:hypothetical protein [Microvirga rosea]|uniref:hypothetical protein n=1 Tax=Microvirga rosea TaxID=2715425 RepID=UPI001D0AF8DD|nr:hypothetical protein [Microvirga rosea]MCB8823274.1 hypothetical protein [Microvirga rosea]